MRDLKKRHGGHELFKRADALGLCPEALVGHRIRVWWPKDAAFYNGVIVSFNRAAFSHKVTYDDGDVEALVLALEQVALLGSSLANIPSADSQYLLDLGAFIDRKAKAFTAEHIERAKTGAGRCVAKDEVRAEAQRLAARATDAFNKAAEAVKLLCSDASLADVEGTVAAHSPGGSPTGGGGPARGRGPVLDLPAAKRARVAGHLGGAHAAGTGSLLPTGAAALGPLYVPMPWPRVPARAAGAAAGRSGAGQLAGTTQHNSASAASPDRGKAATEAAGFVQAAGGQLVAGCQGTVPLSPGSEAKLHHSKASPPKACARRGPDPPHEASSEQQPGAASSGPAAAPLPAAPSAETAAQRQLLLEQGRVCDELRAAYRHFAANASSDTYKQYHELQVVLWLAPVALVGREVRVHWPNEGAWFCGKVTAYDEGTGEHQVEYDDGDREMLYLAAEDVRLQVLPGESLTPQPPCQLDRAAQFMQQGAARVRQEIQRAKAAAAGGGDSSAAGGSPKSEDDLMEMEEKAALFLERAQQLILVASAMRQRAPDREQPQGEGRAAAGPAGPPPCAAGPALEYGQAPATSPAAVKREIAAGPASPPIAPPAATTEPAPPVVQAAGAGHQLAARSEPPARRRGRSASAMQGQEQHQPAAALAPCAAEPLPVAPGAAAAVDAAAAVAGAARPAPGRRRGSGGKSAADGPPADTMMVEARQAPPAPAQGPEGAANAGTAVQGPARHGRPQKRGLEDVTADRKAEEVDDAARSAPAAAGRAPSTSAADAGQAGAKRRGRPPKGAKGPSCAAPGNGVGTATEALTATAAAVGLGASPLPPEQGADAVPAPAPCGAAPAPRGGGGPAAKAKGGRPGRRTLAAAGPADVQHAASSPPRDAAAAAAALAAPPACIAAAALATVKPVNGPPKHAGTLGAVSGAAASQLADIPTTQSAPPQPVVQLQQQPEEDVQQLSLGQLVWGVIGTQLPWPALVITREEAQTDGLTRFSAVASSKVYVRFFGEYTVAALCPADDPATLRQADFKRRLAVAFERGLDLDWATGRSKAAVVPTGRKVMQFRRALCEVRAYLLDGELPASMVPANNDDLGADDDDEEEEGANGGGGGYASGRAAGSYSASYFMASSQALQQLRLPLAVSQKVTLLSLGRVEWINGAFHNEKAIFPVGYSASRVMATAASGGREVEHLMEVAMAADGVTPLFRITPKGCTPVEADTATRAMHALYQGDKRASGRAFALSGLDLFGLSSSRVQGLVRLLPGADRCEQFCNWPDADKPPVPPLAREEQLLRNAIAARSFRLPDGIVPQRQAKEGFSFECEVCGQDEEEDGSYKLECDLCRCVVHMDCYGVRQPPDGSTWLCDVCQLVVRGLPLGMWPACDLCPVIGGAMKRTEYGTFCHVLCALWLPEAGFEDAEKLEPIGGTKEALQARACLKCAACNQAYGACIQCPNKTCKRAFHATCAREAGLAMVEMDVQGAAAAGDSPSPSSPCRNVVAESAEGAAQPCATAQHAAEAPPPEANQQPAPQEEQQVASAAPAAQVVEPLPQQQPAAKRPGRPRKTVALELPQQQPAPQSANEAPDGQQAVRRGAVCAATVAEGAAAPPQPSAAEELQPSSSTRGAGGLRTVVLKGVQLQQQPAQAVEPQTQGGVAGGRLTRQGSATGYGPGPASSGQAELAQLQGPGQRATGSSRGGAAAIDCKAAASSTAVPGQENLQGKAPPGAKAAAAPPVASSAPPAAPLTSAAATVAAPEASRAAGKAAPAGGPGGSLMATAYRQADCSVAPAAAALAAAASVPRRPKPRKSGTVAWLLNKAQQEGAPEGAEAGQKLHLCFCRKHEEEALAPCYLPIFPGRFRQLAAEAAKRQAHGAGPAAGAGSTSPSSGSYGAADALRALLQPEPSSRGRSFGEWRSRGHKAPETVAMAQAKRSYVKQTPYLVTGRLQQSAECVAAVGSSSSGGGEGGGAGGSSGVSSMGAVPIAPRAVAVSAAASCGGGGARHTAVMPVSVAERYGVMRSSVGRRLAAGKSAIHGWGAFAKVPHSKGDMMIEYAGELIRPVLSDERERRLYNTMVGCGTYIFALNESFHVDATRAGNMAHLLNHSCDPNCYSRTITLRDPATGTLHDHVIIMAKRDISAWEELTYDYRFSGDQDLPCNCGAVNCRRKVNLV